MLVRSSKVEVSVIPRNLAPLSGADIMNGKVSLHPSFDAMPVKACFNGHRGRSVYFFDPFEKKLLGSTRLELSQSASAGSKMFCTAFAMTPSKSSSFERSVLFPFIPSPSLTPTSSSLDLSHDDAASVSTSISN
ncbi:hypothetical protein OH77DRAFT_1525972 [Trametes cingulata]|nr:hypothetical protein OH77DRAFT_1525972 [Trametes cingulata]